MKFKIVLTENQWKRISEITNNLGILSAGSIVIPSFIDKLNITTVILGSIAVFVFWTISIITARKY